MSYRIDYQATKKVRGLEKRTASVPALAGLGVLLAVLLATALWPKGSQTVRELIFPGNTAVTVAALEDLSGDLKAGQSVQAALEGFCRQVMEGELVSH